MTAPRPISFLAAIILVFCFGRTISAKPPTKPEIIEANARAAKLVALDDEIRRQFAKEHPGVLPDGKLRLPKADAPALDWCNLNMVSDWHRQLSGDCWANASLEALECSNLIRNNRRFVLSPQPILDHLKLGASGPEMAGQPKTAYDFFLKQGTARLASYAYTGKPDEPKNVPLSFRAVAWGFVSPDGRAPTVDQLKGALLRHGPLVVDLTSTDKFHAYRGGLFNEPGPIDKKVIHGKHVVLLVGWDDTRGENGAWKIKNTWGPKWGEQGFMWIARGSNSVGRIAEWVRAESIHYNLPADEFAALVPDAKPLPLMR